MKVRVVAFVHRYLAALGSPLGGEAVEAALTALERVDGVTCRASKVVLTPLQVVSDESQYKTSLP